MRCGGPSAKLRAVTCTGRSFRCVATGNQPNTRNPAGTCGQRDSAIAAQPRTGVLPRSAPPGAPKPAEVPRQVQGTSGNCAPINAATTAGCRPPGPACSGAAAPGVSVASTLAEAPSGLSNNATHCAPWRCAEA